jgi:hypothetical protein
MQFPGVFSITAHTFLTTGPWTNLNPTSPPIHSRSDACYGPGTSNKIRYVEYRTQSNRFLIGYGNCMPTMAAKAMWEVDPETRSKVT